jgi:hypothetical protein
MCIIRDRMTYYIIDEYGTKGRNPHIPILQDLSEQHIPESQQQISHS